ncbi:hypothetical protein ACTJIJ_22390 [Niabella sp. 22666]|uniref:hypothetical protein n=1 Tax=Niabella sp. 22666 TaxID=3453954 RepID=UPI003F863BE9
MKKQIVATLFMGWAGVGQAQSTGTVMATNPTNESGVYISADVGGFGILQAVNHSNSFAKDLLLQYYGGNVAIGSTIPENAEGWGKVLEVKGALHAKSMVSTANIISGLWSHESGHYGAPAGGISGTYTNHPFSFITNKVSRMTITSDGRVGIGTATPPAAYKLAVAGNIIAEQVRVQLQSSGWPDYVFKPQYKLMPLSQVEDFIKEKGHLPDVPSAEQVAKEGVELGTNQALLLKKIEEMTLHLISINKRVESLEAENRLLKKQLEKPALK